MFKISMLHKFYLVKIFISKLQLNFAIQKEKKISNLKMIIFEDVIKFRFNDYYIFNNCINKLQYC